MPIHDSISVSDFNFAAFLYAKGCKLIQLDRENPKRVNFIFKDVPQEIIDAFWQNGEIKVNDFIHAQYNLKGRLYHNIH